MHLIASETPIPRPGSTDWVKVFFPNYLEESYRRKQLENHFVLMFSARIGMKEIRSNPSQYVMLFRPSMLGSDFGGILPERTRCLYSRWDGNLDRPDWQAVTQALEKVDGDLITLTLETSPKGYSAAPSQLGGHVARMVGRNGAGRRPVSFARWPTDLVDSQESLEARGHP